MKSSILEKHTLTQWLSPSYPIGAYNFSQGLEYAVKEALVCNEETLSDWLSENLEAGYFWNDAILKTFFFRLLFNQMSIQDLFFFKNSQPPKTLVKVLGEHLEFH